MTVLAHLGPELLPPSGWQCPACKTCYPHDVKECRCAADKPLSERIRKDPPISLGGPDRKPPEMR